MVEGLLLVVIKLLVVGAWNLGLSRRHAHDTGSLESVFFVVTARLYGRKTLIVSLISRNRVDVELAPLVAKFVLYLGAYLVNYVLFSLGQDNILPLFSFRKRPRRLFVVCADL